VTQLALEVLDVLILVQANALFLEQLLAECLHLPALLCELLKLVVIIRCQRLSAPEIDQHLRPCLDCLLDFLLGARPIENFAEITWIAHRRTHPRPKDRNDDLGIRRPRTQIDRRLRRAIGQERRVRIRVIVAEDVELERFPKGFALGKLLLDQLGRSLPLLRHVAGRGDKDPHEPWRQFAHVASGCSLIWRRSASRLLASVWFPVSMLSSRAAADQAKNENSTARLTRSTGIPSLPLTTACPLVPRSGSAGSAMRI
jgi:hypothetical protein